MVKQEFIRTPDGSQTIIDYNLEARNYFKLPVFQGAPTLNDNADEGGAIGFFNNKAMLYVGSNVWKSLAFGGDLDDDFLKLTGGVVTGDVQYNVAPVNGFSLVNRAYVDNAVSGLIFKKEARAASISNVNVSSAPSSIDGVTLVNGDRVLLKNQNSPAQNGIRVFTAAGSPLLRSDDADTGSELTNKTVPVTEGTTNQDTWWTIINDTITIDVTGISFTQTGGMGTYANGLGLNLSGNIFSLDLSYTDARYSRLTGNNVYLGTNEFNAAVRFTQAAYSNTTTLSYFYTPGSQDNGDGLLMTGVNYLGVPITTTKAIGVKYFAQQLQTGYFDTAYVTTNSAQTGLTGDKTTSGMLTIAGTTGTPITTTTNSSANGGSFSGRNNSAGIAQFAGISVYNTAASTGRYSGVRTGFTGKNPTAFFGGTMANTVNGAGSAVVGVNTGGVMTQRFVLSTSGAVSFGTTTSASAGFYIAPSVKSAAITGTGRNVWINGVVNATANNDVLVGLELGSTFSSSGAIATTATLVGGSGYADGSWTGVPLSGGTGSGAEATITVAGGVVTGVTITVAGGGYTVNDQLSADPLFDLVGTGSGFTVNVATISNYTGVITYALRSTGTGIGSFTGAFSFGGGISLNNATKNAITFGAGAAIPSFTTASIGEKFVLSNAISGTTTNYAIGIEANAMWFGVSNFSASQSFKWYGGTTQVMSLTGNGVLTVTGVANISGAVSTGALTASISTSSSGSVFLTHTSGLIQSRTAAQVLTDIGALSASGTAANSVLWNGAAASAATPVSMTGIMVFDNINAQYRLASAGIVQSFLGVEKVSNKATDFTVLNNNLYPTTQAVAAYLASAGGGIPSGSDGQVIGYYDGGITIAMDKLSVLDIVVKTTLASSAGTTVNAQLNKMNVIDGGGYNNLTLNLPMGNYGDVMQFKFPNAINTVTFTGTPLQATNITFVGNQYFLTLVFLDGYWY